MSERTWAELADAATDAAWPVATLSPHARLAALAAGLPGTVTEQRVFDAPFDRVWDFIADLPRSVPAFDSAVADLQVVDRDGSRLIVRSRAPWTRGGLRNTFDVDLQPGWCWMVARHRLFVVGMAATPDLEDPDRTVFTHLEGMPVGGRLARCTRFVHRRQIRADLDGMERALGC
ncbi:MAG: hypothetical protein ABIP03_05860 [Aquihabitans sp.]